MSILLADIDATCAALGYSDGQKYQAEPDAIQGLKHLIWILRRDLDNHEYRRHLGRAKVLQTDLVYMLPQYIDDDEYADVLIRLLVILTNPTLLLYRDGPPKDNHGRKVFMELIDILQGYKSAFTRDKIWAALFSKLQKVLEVDWALRSEEQGLLVERILVLIRNVLQVPANPEAECRADNDASLHDQVIWALHQSGILDLVLFVVSSPDEHQYYLHGLEILCLLYREQTAESLADASLQRSVSEKQRDEQELMAARRREKQRQLARPPTGRHSRFGGTYVIRNLKSVSDRDIICHQPLERVMALDFDREKEQQKRSHRHVREQAQVARRSAFSVRLCLREYCIEILRSAYNTLVRQVRRVLERNAGSAGHDDSYLLWAIRFFMEFNRLSGMQLQLVSESLSVQCFHWVLTRVQHDMDMIVSDKKQARLWAKRLHVALVTFRELLQSLVALQKSQDDNARALFDMLLNNVCYVLEYRETILHLLMNYNEAHSTKAYLQDVTETANIFIKMMEKFCKDSVVVQDKKRAPKKRGGRKQDKQTEKTPEESEEELANKWVEMAAELTTVLSNEMQLPEEDLPIPFDAASDKNIDDQKEDCMIRIHKLLRGAKLDQAVALMRAAREVWPENDVFGGISAAPEDELLLLREIFMHNITTVEGAERDTNEAAHDDPEDDDEEGGEYDEEEDNGTVEKAFKFDDFSKRLLNAKIVRACTVVLTDWEQIPTKCLKAAVTILHRIAYGCSCPAMLYQAKLFRIFQQVFHAARDPHQEELRRLGAYVVRKFVETAPNNPKIYAELLFYKSVKEANELESGYCDAYESGTKGTWTEEQEAELRFLFEENQRNPETEKDVIDWILDNLIDKTRTRRGILKKLKDLGLQFKAPTKKSTAAVANEKNLWRSEEDEELRSLYDQYRTEDDCLQRILDEFEERRNKQQVIKRMLQLHIIADKSEILPQKPRKRKPKKKNTDDDSMDEDAEMEEPQFGDSHAASASRSGSKSKKSKPKISKAAKPVKRKIVKTPLDVGTVRGLLSQVGSDKLQETIDWLRECLDDAAEDTDEPSEEDDGVPLVPLQEAQKLAMEDANFQKILVALGMQPPILGMESYWRIPTYLNAADLKLRAKVVAGEEVTIDVDGIDDGDDNEEHSDEEGSEDSDDDDGNDDDGDDDERADELGKKNREESEEEEEDVFEGYLERRRKELQASEVCERADRPGKADHKVQKDKRQRKSKKVTRVEESAEDLDDDMVDAIKKKLDRKKRQAEVTSDEESDVYDSIKKTAKKNEKKVQKKKAAEEEQMPIAGSDLLFDQLKANRANKRRRDAANTEDVDELNFNSEDYRKRLLELGDSDDNDNGDGDGDGDEGTIIAAQHDNNNFIANNSNSKNRTRRANVIDSDSDEQDVQDVQEMQEVQEQAQKMKNDTHEHGDESTLQNSAGDDNVAVERAVVDKTSNQTNVYSSHDSVGSDPARRRGRSGIDSYSNVDGRGDGNNESVATSAPKRNNKRRRSNESDTGDVNNENATANDASTVQDEVGDDDEDALFLVRKKPTKAERDLIASGEESAKRRRIAIIDDDDDD